MDLDYSTPGVVNVSMKGMIEEAIVAYELDGVTSTPAAINLFKVSTVSVPLDDQRRGKFHSTVQLLLYIAKRARPDILTAISFLTTRVTIATDEDEGKLIRVLKYLKGTKDLCLVISGSDGMLISAYIDASFAVHGDGKGNTGVVIFTGKGAVYSKANKQKLVARSSTEAELIGVSDGLVQVLWTKMFLEAQGYSPGPAKLYQDNKSTIILAEKEKLTSYRTRHVSERNFFIKDRIESKDVELKYMATEAMVADFFTKPLQGSLFIKFRDIIMNHGVEIAGVCCAESR
jgi:hypothetical protein